MKRLTRRTIVALACCVLLLLGAAVVSAGKIPASKVVFCKYGAKTGMTTTFELWSPLRSGGNEWFPAVTSKWNQPRVVDEDAGESNPHLGCDLDVSNVVVYPLFRGWVDLAEGSDIVVYLDLDGDGVRDDGAWAHYKHMSQISVVKDQEVLETTPLGRSMTGTDEDHLHFGVLKNYSSTTKEGLWAPLERYYPQGWNTGKDLDYICAIQHVGNVVKATAYSMNNGVKEYLHTHDVWLCHRKAGTGDLWQQELMSLVSGSQTQWQFSLTGKYPAGTTVAYMVIAQRDVETPSGYKWGIFPGKYYQPPAPNPDEARAYDYLTITLQ